MRVSAAQLAAGQLVYVGPANLRRAPWQVVRVHEDGSATVRVDGPQSEYERFMYGQGVAAAESITMQTPVQTVHDIVYVRGPLARRYRCKGCDWVGALPAEHP